MVCQYTYYNLAETFSPHALHAYLTYSEAAQSKPAAYPTSSFLNISTTSSLVILWQEFSESVIISPDLAVNSVSFLSHIEQIQK